MQLDPAFGVALVVDDPAAVDMVLQNMLHMPQSVLEVRVAAVLTQYRLSTLRWGM